MEKRKRVLYFLSLIVLFLAVVSLLDEDNNRDQSPPPPVYCGFDELEENENRVILIGDTQGKGPILEFWREDNRHKTPLILNEIAGRNPACVLNLGDLVFCGSYKSHWKRFDDAHGTIHSKKIPYFPLPGNHEYFCDHGKSSRNYFSRFPHLDHDKWYSFRFRTIAFIMLDSNFENLTPAQNRTQTDWYRKQLEMYGDDPGTDYVIICFHHPPYTNSRVVKPSLEAGERFVQPALDRDKVVAFFSGHCHSYERFEVNGKYFIVSGGGGGPRQGLDTKKDKREFDDLFDHDGPAIRFLNFCQLQINPGGLTIEVIKLNEDKTFSIADAFCIRKPD